MEHLFSLLLLLLEMTFIFAGLALLHSQRKLLGATPFYMVMGMLFVFLQFVNAVDMRAALIGTFEFKISPVVLSMPYLGALLMVYITEGTLATQRLIIGALALFGIFLYLGELTRMQCNWLGFTITSGQLSESIDLILKSSLHSMGAMVFSQTLALFALPIIYTRLKEMKFNLFCGVMLALVCTQMIDILFYVLIAYWKIDNLLVVLSGAMLARILASCWIAALLALYLKMIEAERVAPHQNALDIVFAFFGGYSRSIMLEKNLREWEDRYKVILESAAEMVVVLSLRGHIMDTNAAADQILYERAGLSKKDTRLLSLLHDDQGIPIYKSIVPRFPEEKTLAFHGVLADRNGELIYLGCTLSPVTMLGRRVLALIARDETGERKLAQEKVQLSLELAHSQRIESLGRLAGGVAHDFNNHLHAILGHVDLIRMLSGNLDESAPGAAKHLDKIAEIAESSGKLTSQLLGFARRGKYREEKQHLSDVLRRALAMIPPQQRCETEIIAEPCAQDLPITGDPVQLQQVIVNLIINAIDALKDRPAPRTIRIGCGLLADCKDAPTPTNEDLTPENCACVTVADNGCGMDEKTIEKIFEPFFTTKPVGEGTGMGLSMVYGTMENHHGGVKLKSTIGKGTTFYLYFPLTRA